MADQGPERVSIKITPGMAFPIGAACTARLAEDGPAHDALRHTLEHFLYWCTHVDALGSAFTFTFTKADDGAIGWSELRVLRDLLLESRRHADGRTWPAILRRLAKIESALGIDAVSRLGARSS